jgi:hypothetical protein
MTPALWTDLVLLVLLAAGAVAGWRRGGLRLAGAVVGLLAGLVVGHALAPTLTGSLSGNTGHAVRIASVAVAGLLGAALGRWAGSVPAALLARLHLGVADRAAGAVGGAVLALAIAGGALLLASAADRGAVLSPTAGWLATARGTELGRTATGTADRAARLLMVHVPGHRDLLTPEAGEARA